MALPVLASLLSTCVMGCAAGAFPLASAVPSGSSGAPKVSPSSLIPAPEAATDAPTTSDAAGAADAATEATATRRVGGDLEAVPEKRGENWICGDMVVEAPLPHGYPAPTPAGAIELKNYPSVRRAEYRGTGGSDRGRNGAFWPLFQHIKSRDIAMTSPVEMDYPGWPVAEQPKGGADAPGQAAAQGRWVMSFLYRSADLGPTGEDGSVRVVDTEPVTVLAIGLRGPYGESLVGRGIERLEAWLVEHPEWEIAGDPRAFYYNGPYVANRNKWSEVHLPVRPKVDCPQPDPG